MVRTLAWPTLCFPRVPLTATRLREATGLVAHQGGTVVLRRELDSWVLLTSESRVRRQDARESLGLEPSLAHQPNHHPAHCAGKDERSKDDLFGHLQHRERPRSAAAGGRSAA